MGKYFITGRPGSGKTTIIKRLQERGYTAYNTDDLPGSTQLQSQETGEVVAWPKGAVDWNKYAWNWQAEYIKKLLNRDGDVFLGAIVGNQANFYELFDKVFVLVVDVPTLRKQLEQHEHDTHHMPGAIDKLAKAHLEKQQHLIDAGAIPIPGGRPVDDIVDDILKAIM